MRLPSHYLITPNVDNEEEFLMTLERSLQQGSKLVQLKGKGLDDHAYEVVALKVIAMVHRHGGRVLLTGDPARVQRLGADGLHLDSKALKTIDTRPLPEPYLIAVSGHDLVSLKKGETLGASFAVLSPIRYTKAHPEIEPHGWEGMKAIIAQLAIPVYALGGVDAADEVEALKEGAAGIAGHRGYWQK